MNITKEQLALKFHETYERLAPQFGYETRSDTKTFDPESNNGRLMIAVCESIMRGLAEDAEPVAICAVTPQGEVSIGWRHGYKPRHNENLYTSPQAACCKNTT